MDKELIEKFRQYARTDETYAILFVKKYLERANAGVWIDILGAYAPAGYPTDKLRFKKVECELFPRRIQPVYPNPKKFWNREDYIETCRAVTWEAARTDIDRQRRKGYEGPAYRIEGVCFPVHTGKLVVSEPGFKPGTPQRFLRLAENPDDRTDPLWDEAIRYWNPGVEDTRRTIYQYKVTKVTRLR